LLAFAGAALVGRERIRIGRLEWGLLGSFAALSFWIAASAIWSDSQSASLLEGERAVVYLSGLAAILLVAERPAIIQLIGGIVGAVMLVCGYSLALRAFDSNALDPAEGDLLYKPIGYANALGILAAIAIVLAVGLMLAVQTRLARALLLGSLAIFFPALYLTSSRGGWVALAAGLVVFVWCLYGTCAGRC